MLLPFLDCQPIQVQSGNFKGFTLTLRLVSPCRKAGNLRRSRILVIGQIICRGKFRRKKLKVKLAADSAALQIGKEFFYRVFCLCSF